MKEESITEKIGKSLGKDFPKAVSENRTLISAVTLVFFLSSAVAFASNQMGENPVNNIVEEGTEGARETIGEEAKKERTPLELTGFFIKNNLVSAIQTIGFGAAFGIFSVYALLLNGAMIGYVGSTSGFSLLQFLSFILPHGVFELTGFILAISSGLRLGIGSIKSVSERDLDPLKKAGDKIEGLVLPLVFIILIAAFVEAALGAYGDPIFNSIPLQLTVIGISLMNLVLVLFWMDGRIMGDFKE